MPTVGEWRSPTPLIGPRMPPAFGSREHDQIVDSAPDLALAPEATIAPDLVLERDGRSPAH